MAGKKHVHKYNRVDVGYAKVWACALPYCSHFMPHHMNNLMPGKKSICWNCEKEFVLDEHNMKDDKPKCTNCSSDKVNILEYVDSIMNDSIMKE